VVTAVLAAWCCVIGTVGCTDDESGAKRSADSIVTPSQLESVLGDVRTTLGAPWGVTVPGLAATVTVGADDSLSGSTAASGVADPPGTSPLTDRDQFHVGSVTKTFTAALIMQLDQDGQLSLDDYISNWVDYPNGDAITVEMLLGHTSGIPEYFELAEDVDATTPEEAVALAGAAPQLAEPGSAFEYANTNYFLLGLIAEQVTGSTWEQEVRTRFIEPLGLADTYVWTGEPQGPTVTGSRIACDYPGEPPCDPALQLPLVAVTDNAFWVNAWSAGAIVSTPRDLARWMRALVEGDVVDRDHVDLMTTPSAESLEAFAEMPAAGPLRLIGMGLGLATYEIDGLGTGYGHNGQVPGFVSNVVHLPESSVSVAVAANFEQLDNLELLGEVAVRAIVS
jgi:D-alanyl-D-alanine carboxypeptidase